VAFWRPRQHHVLTDVDENWPALVPRPQSWSPKSQKRTFVTVER
jgi:hypothetical protein